MIQNEEGTQPTHRRRRRRRRRFSRSRGRVALMVCHVMSCHTYGYMLGVVALTVYV